MIFDHVPHNPITDEQEEEAHVVLAILAEDGKSPLLQSRENILTKFLPRPLSSWVVLSLRLDDQSLV